MVKTLTSTAGKNTGVGCCFLLQRIFPTQGLNPHLTGRFFTTEPPGKPALAYLYFFSFGLSGIITGLWLDSSSLSTLGSKGRGRGGVPSVWTLIISPGFDLDLAIISGLPRWQSTKEFTCQCRRRRRYRRRGFNPWVRRSPGGEHGSPLQYSYLENPMDWGAWQVTRSHTQLSNWTYTHTLALISLPIWYWDLSPPSHSPYLCLSASNILVGTTPILKGMRSSRVFQHFTGDLYRILVKLVSVTH